jgi:hypothetical protein
LLQFTFTNVPGAVFDVIVTTNLAVPVNQWTVRGGVTEVSPGYFQFTDAPATNAQFYRVRSQ